MRNEVMVSQLRRSLARKTAVLAGLPAMFATGFAMAQTESALATAATDSISNSQTDVSAVFVAVIAIVGLMVAGGLVIKALRHN